MKDFFVSYNRADRSWAEWIAWQLEQDGYSVVVQAWDFRPGSNFVLDMQRAAAEAQRTIAVLSPDYLDARFTQPEWAAAFAQDPTGEQGRLLPVRVRVCEPDGLLPQIVYVDLVGLEESAAKEALLAGASRERAKPSAAPRFPVAAAAGRVVPERPRFPGALPPIWNIPHQRNPNFTGRVELLEALEGALASTQAAALTQAIHGLGGVGKTQLAVEYAYRHTGAYDLVWWVRAEETTTLAADYAGLARELNLPEKDAAEQALAVDAVRRWLEHNRGWLLVFDNANQAANLDPYRPRGAGGHILVTSRDPRWRGAAQPLRVEEMTRAEAVSFLLKRSGQADEAAAHALAETLGDLPLALEQAGAYVEATDSTLTAYLSLFETYQSRLLDEVQPTDYPVSITKTWELSFEQAQQTAPAAVELLNLCAFLAPDDIPLALIRAGAEHLPEALAGAARDRLAFNRAVAALRCYSLIEVSDDIAAIHRMVQAVARDRLDRAERQAFAAAAVSLVNDAFPFKSDDVQTWTESARLLPHALAATTHAEAAQAAPEATARLLNQVGMYLRGRAEFMEAKAAFERALAIGEGIYGPDHPEVAIWVNNLGRVLQDLGDLPGAKAAFERAVAIGEAAYGPNHPQVAIYVNNLGDVLRDLGDLPGAKAAFERALALDEATYGSNHPTVAIRVNNLGNVLRNLGDLPGAKAAFERALAISEAAYGPNHPTVAIRVNNLGNVLRDLGDLPGAKAAYERAVAIGEAAYGPNHPTVAIYVNNLGLVLQDLGDLAGAKAAFERALAIDEATYGPDHPTVAIRINNLGGVLRDLGDLPAAKAAYERALKIFRRFLGEDHPTTIGVRKNLESLERLHQG